MTGDGTRRPTVTITFAGPGQADMDVQLDGVSQAQLYGAAWLLEAMAQEVRRGAVAAAALERAAVHSLAAGIRNGGRG